MVGLLEAFGLRRGSVVALVGAGGKTTTLYRLAREAAGAGWRVLLTSTTHMGAPRAGDLVLDEEGDALRRVRVALERTGQALVLGRRLREDKLAGVPPGRVDELAALADLVVVEADGARGRSLKAPAAHEPVLPGSTSLLLALAGLDVLGAAFDGERVHRLDEVARATGLGPGGVVDEAAVRAALAWPEGYVGRTPAGASRAVFLNKAEGDERWQAARRLAAGLVPPFHGVWAGSAQAGTAERLSPAWRLGALVLAAGGSSRLGQPKMLLRVAGRSLLAAAVEPLLAVPAIAQVVVVLGAQAETVRREAGLPADERLRVVVNPDWAAGLSSSLRRGLAECPDMDGVLVALADQVGLTAGRVEALAAAWDGAAPLVVPVAAERIGHPVLFASAVFPELHALAGDVGARDVVRRHLASAIRVPAAPLPDVDTPAERDALAGGRLGAGGHGLPD